MNFWSGRKSHLGKKVPAWYNDFAFYVGNHVGIVECRRELERLVNCYLCRWYYSSLHVIGFPNRSNNSGNIDMKIYESVCDEKSPIALPRSPFYSNSDSVITLSQSPNLLLKNFKPWFVIWTWFNVRLCFICRYLLSNLAYNAFFISGLMH